MDVEFGGRKFILNIELKLAVKSQILLTYKYFMKIFIAKYVNISDPQKNICKYKHLIMSM